MSYVKPDQSTRLQVNYDGEQIEFLLSPVYDRIDRFEKLGFSMLKIVDAERGFVKMPISDADVARIGWASSLPVVEREFIYDSEYQLYLKSQERGLDDSWLE